MYSYRRRNRIGPGSIFLIVLFASTIIGLAYIAYLDKGKFWDILPIVGIPGCIISLIAAIFNLVRKTGGGYIFLLFFMIFLAGTVLSSVFGPFAVYREAERDLEAKRYQESIQSYKVILENYPGSRYVNPSLENISYACYQSGRY
ncbi:MAG: hypothetical protein H5T85_05345, partial [Actinobacteria bacterium]|nr:hypothetical protein [Actinomycetota bacterium]